MAITTTFLSLCLVTASLLGQVMAEKSSGCGKAVPSAIKPGGFGQSNNISFTTSSDIKRSFLLHLPLAYDVNTGHGLIFSFHGRSEDASSQESRSRLSDPALNPHMLVVFPNGINQEWQGDPDATSDDVGFTLDVINSMESEFCIDTDQIFASGMSNGGGFSANILACDPVASKKIAAFAGVSGAYYQGTTDANCQPDTVPVKCNPGRKPIPILEFHGQTDGVIPYVGGPRRNRCLPSIPHFITSWADRNGLGTSNKTTTLGGGHVKQYQFGSGARAGLNTHYWIDGMGHTWPNAQDNQFNGTSVVMDFFNKVGVASGIQVLDEY
jgi:poly(3-hydroxybutyrate) depolymerase